MAIDPDARSGLQAVTVSNIIDFLRGPDEVGSQVRLKIMKRGQKRASLSKHASLAGRLSLSPGAPARRDSLPQSPLSIKAEQLEFTLTRVDFREVEKVKDLFMSIVELRAHAQNPKPEHLARLANELEAGLLNLVDWTTAVEDKQRAHVADLERLVESVARDGAAALEHLAAFHFKELYGESGALSKLSGERELFAFQLSVLLHMIVFEECTNQWSLSRPLLALILINEHAYKKWQEQAIASMAAHPSRQQKLSQAFEKLMTGVPKGEHANLDVKTRDKFTQNLAQFRHDMRSLV